ncbi:MAG: NUDIX domain-containing protein [Desulfobacula sp.]|uniref:NUDIX hydrolase n=1 Tax=Desulfobacula sp. TaxID=2593537 RepID=UPI0025BE5AEA|nr:NUDIX domain-containing protein [Desulfobacula sp.]MCD4719708.1 NUDIX domain-containing protein [Desulfobacula sp.]
MKNPNDYLFKYCPQCGGKSLVISDEKSFLCSSCNFKFYLNTAAAGIALIFNKKGELLVTKRRYDPAKGMLDFPGGFTDPGETIEACLIREIKEELNLKITSLKYFCSVPNTYVYKTVTYSIIDFAFLCSVDDFDTIKASDDVSDFYFMELTNLDINRFGLDSPKIVIDRLREGPISITN